MNTNDKVTIAEISKEITIAQTDKSSWWKKEGENNENRKKLAEAINLHGWELDGIPSILRHIYSLIESGTITARSTVNGLKPNSINQIAANTANWYVSSVDAKRIFSELVAELPEVDSSSASDDGQAAAEPLQIQTNNKTPQIRDKGLRQTEAIIAELKRLGHDPLCLPALIAGQRSAKAEARENLNGKDLFTARTAFKNMWEESTRRGLIKNIK